MRSALLAALLPLLSLLSGCPAASPFETTPVQVQLQASPPPPEAPPAKKGNLVEGLGGLRVGATADEVRGLLGHEESVVAFDDEREKFAGAGYDIEMQVPFAIGFDQVLYFEENDTLSLPAWKVYMKGGRAILIKFTKAGFEDRIQRTEFGIAPSCYLGRPAEGVTESLGPPPLEEHEQGYVEAHYLDRGVSVITDATGIIVLDVYGELAADVRARLEEAIRKGESHRKGDDEGQ